MVLARATPNWLERGLVEKARKVLFCLLLFVYYYAVCGKLNVAVKYAVNVVIFCWAVAEFLLAPNIPKAMALLKFMAVFFAPFLLLLLYSFGIWILDLKGQSYMLRGSQNVLYMATNMMMVAGSYYLMEEDCIDLHALMAVAANGFCFLLVGRSFGFGPLLTQYYRQVITFAAESGDAIQKMEFHDLTYAFGALCVYYALHKKRGRHQWFLLAACLLSFFCAMKKIGMIAAILAVVFGLVYRYLTDVGRKRLIWFSAVLAVAGSFAYVWSIKTGLFRTIVMENGIDTSGRVGIYDGYQNAYSFSPLFFGHGIRYIYNTATQGGGGWATVHNVYLELFVELGFWMLLFFELYEMAIRQSILSKSCGWKYLELLAVGTVYIFITYLTDNTSFQPPVNTVYRMVGMVGAMEGMAVNGSAQWKRVAEPEDPPDWLMRFLAKHRSRKALRRSTEKEETLP